VVHRTLIILALLLTVSGIAIIFVYRSGWSESAGIHAYFGVTVFAVMILNVILGLARPAIGKVNYYNS